jgi:hypothetical protein
MESYRSVLDINNLLLHYYGLLPACAYYTTTLSLSHVRLTPVRHRSSVLVAAAFPVFTSDTCALEAAIVLMWCINIEMFVGSGANSFNVWFIDTKTDTYRKISVALLVLRTLVLLSWMTLLTRA